MYVKTKWKYIPCCVKCVFFFCFLLSVGFVRLCLLDWNAKQIWFTSRSMWIFIWSKNPFDQTYRTNNILSLYGMEYWICYTYITYTVQCWEWHSQKCVATTIPFRRNFFFKLTKVKWNHTLSLLQNYNT